MFYNLIMIQTNHKFGICGYWKLGQDWGRGGISRIEAATFPDFKIFIYNELSKTVYTGQVWSYKHK